MAIFSGKIIEAYFANSENNTVEVIYKDGDRAINHYLPVDFNSEEFKDLIEEYDTDKIAEATIARNRRYAQQLSDVVDAGIKAKTDLKQKISVGDFVKKILNYDDKDSDAKEILFSLKISVFEMDKIKNCEDNDYKTKLNDQKIREHKRLKDMLNDMTLDFGKKDVKEITKHDILNFVDSLKTKDNRPYTDSSKNKYRTLAKQILNYAYDNTNDKGDRFLDQQIVIPTTSNTSQNFNPPFTTENFDKISLELKRRMYDVSNKDLLKIIKSPTEFKKLKDDFRDKFLNHTLTHTQEIWSEIHDCVMFIYGSFLRAGSEFTEMRFKDISIEDVIIDGKRIKTLQLRPIASKVKTYDYDTYSMPFCVSLFKDAMIRRENYKPNDFVFFHNSYPTYKRRNTFGKWLSDKFREVLEFTNTRHDPKTGQTMSLRCLRNTALTRRRESSNANPFDIASNARTSTEMLNRFYNRQVDRKKIASKVLSFK